MVTIKNLIWPLANAREFCQHPAKVGAVGVQLTEDLQWMNFHFGSTQDRDIFLDRYFPNDSRHRATVWPETVIDAGTVRVCRSRQ